MVVHLYTFYLLSCRKQIGTIRKKIYIYKKKKKAGEIEMRSTIIKDTSALTKLYDF